MESFQVSGTECNQLRSGIVGMGRKGGIRENYDGYVRWLFRLNYCTPRYVITREVDIN